MPMVGTRTTPMARSPWAAEAIAQLPAWFGRRQCGSG